MQYSKKSATIVCIVGVCVSSIFATGAGSLILGVFDAFLNNFALLFAVLLECIIFGWIYDFDKLIATLNENSKINEDPVSITIKAILLIVLIALPIIFTKLPAKNEDFYKEVQH